MRINVTQRDIDQGVRADPELCPIARAIRRHRDVTFVKVGTNFVSISRGALNDSNLPPEAIKWIALFDRTAHSTKPFAFDLPVPA